MSEYPNDQNPYFRTPADIPPVWGNPVQPPRTGQGADTSPIDHSATAAADATGGKRFSTMAKTLTAVGVAAVIAVGGTIAVTSANASGSSTGAPAGVSGAGVAADGSGGFAGPGGSGPAAGMEVILSALHGEFVVADGTATVIERIQTGSVTAVSATALTVQSTDGFTASYSVGSGVSVTSFPTGTEVTVVAKVSGTTATATAVTAARTAGMGTAMPGQGASGLTGATPGQ